MEIFLAIWGTIIGYRLIFAIFGFITPPKKFKRTDKQYNYAVLIPARNEELVIAQLIKSIKEQDYPSDKISIFVVAHNCTDNTAKNARTAGANVYEFNSKMKRKGIALDYLLKQIREKYSSPEQTNGIKVFDGYFVFDADNLLATDFVTQMNKAFDNKKHDAMLGYINMKNVSTTVTASYSSIILYATTLQMMRPISVLGLSQPLRGTGKLVRSCLLEKGYPWHALAEDVEFTNHMISKGYRTTYCEKAEYFDEQPLSLRILARQRMRWIRGTTWLFFKNFPSLLLGIIAPYHKKKSDKSERRRFSLLAELQKRISCVYRLIEIAPVWILQFAISTLYPIIMVVIVAFTGNGNLSQLTLIVVLYFIYTYFYYLLYFSFTLLREHRKMRVRPTKIARHLFIIPFIAIILDYVSFVAAFWPVKWKPIPHVIGKEIGEVQNEKTLAYYMYDHWTVDAKETSEKPNQKD